MKTLPHIILLPGRAAITATITIYKPCDSTQVQHDDLYRPDGTVWGVATIDHADFRNRVWTVSTDRVSEATRHLRAEIEDCVRAQLGLPPVNPYLLMLPV